MARSDDGQAAEFDDSDGADGESVPDSVETLGGDEVEEVEEADARAAAPPPDRGTTRSRR